MKLEIEKERARERQKATFPQKGEKGFKPVNVVPKSEPHNREGNRNCSKESGNI